MSVQTAVFKAHSNSYDIFILVLTIMSLAVMALLLLPLSAETLQLLRVYDNVICIVFLVDFFGNLTGARPKNAYLVGRRGWLDLLGSIPSFGIIPASVYDDVNAKSDGEAVASQSQSRPKKGDGTIGVDEDYISDDRRGRLCSRRRAAVK